MQRRRIDCLRFHFGKCRINAPDVCTPLSLSLSLSLSSLRLHICVQVNTSIKGKRRVLCSRSAIRPIRLRFGVHAWVHEGVHAYSHARTRSVHNATHCVRYALPVTVRRQEYGNRLRDTTVFILPSPFLPLSRIFFFPTSEFNLCNVESLTTKDLYFTCILCGWVRTGVCILSSCNF